MSAISFNTNSALGRLVRSAGVSLEKATSGFIEVADELVEKNCQLLVEALSGKHEGFELPQDLATLATHTKNAFAAVQHSKVGLEAASLYPSATFDSLAPSSLPESFRRIMFRQHLELEQYGSHGITMTPDGGRRHYQQMMDVGGYKLFTGTAQDAKEAKALLKYLSPTDERTASTTLAWRTYPSSNDMLNFFKKFAPDSAKGELSIDFRSYVDGRHIHPYTITTPDPANPHIFKVDFPDNETSFDTARMLYSQLVVDTSTNTVALLHHGFNVFTDSPRPELLRADGSKVNAKRLTTREAMGLGVQLIPNLHEIGGFRLNDLEGELRAHTILKSYEDKGVTKVITNYTDGTSQVEQIVKDPTKTDRVKRTLEVVG